MRKQRKNNSRKQSREGQQGTVYVTISMGPSEALTGQLQVMGEPTSVGLTILSTIIAVFSMYCFHYGMRGEVLTFAICIQLFSQMHVPVLIVSFTTEVLLSHRLLNNYVRPIILPWNSDLFTQMCLQFVHFKIRISKLNFQPALSTCSIFHLLHLT